MQFVFNGASNVKKRVSDDGVSTTARTNQLPGTRSQPVEQKMKAAFERKVEGTENELRIDDMVDGQSQRCSSPRIPSQSFSSESQGDPELITLIMDSDQDSDDEQKSLSLTRPVPRIDF
jgi:hypothetical protein